MKIYWQVFKPYLTVIIFLCISPMVAAQEVKLSLSELITKIVKNYPSLDIAALQIERARQEFSKVESQLGWVFSAQTGVARDTSFIDSPTDHFEAGVGLGRKYESGSSLELSGTYSYDDSEVTFGPYIPDPAHRTRLDVKYRIPLARGQDNPAYVLGKQNAVSNLHIQQSSQHLVIDNLVSQAMSLYYDALLTYIRIDDARQAITRAKRLNTYIENNKRLGLSEDKDILRVQSQLKRQIAQRDSLMVVWHKQRIELNRLMGLPALYEFVPVLEQDFQIDMSQSARLLEQIYMRNPELAIQKGKLQLADVEIKRAQDAKLSQLDLILSVGSRTASGETVAGNVSNEELVGGARLEYRFDMDERGIDAQLYQAMLQKQQAELEISRIQDDLKYQLDGLLLQVKTNEKAVRSNAEHYIIEKQKMEEVYGRYKEGRATTNELIDFEEALHASHLLHQSQKVSLSRNYATVFLLLGTLWDITELENRVNRYSDKDIVK